MRSEILSLVREKGLLLDRDIFGFLQELSDADDARKFLEYISKISGGKMITKNVIYQNSESVKEIVNRISEEGKSKFEKVFIKFGVSVEISRKVESSTRNENAKREDLPYKIFYSETTPDKKLEVSDFTGMFRARYQQLQRVLMNRPDLQNNLTSINKLSSNRAAVSIIGIVTEKRITKNKNLIVTFEDLTGTISGIVKFDNEEIFAKASELQLDDVVGVKASGSRELLFIHDLIYPDSIKEDKTRFEEDMWIGFLSDMHCGSDRHLEKSVNNFLKWIETDKEISPKIRYLFFSGDNVDGVGIFPGQENVLKLKSMREQYKQLARYLERIPKRITMFMCPGQHDATRVAEPQPVISKRYAPELYDIENLVLVTNPTLVKLLEEDKEFKVLMYHGASIHSLINEIPELRESKAHRCPAKAVRHMLKRRHLAPTHSAVVYIPNSDVDPLVINEVPDVLCTGEVHRLDVENHNGVLIITGSCWQAQTPFEEKVGNIPDPGKVAFLNLKTRELRVLDFSDEEEVNREY